MSQHSVTMVDFELSFTDAPVLAVLILASLQNGGIVGDGIHEGNIYRQWLQSFGDNLTSLAQG